MHPRPDAPNAQRQKARIEYAGGVNVSAMMKSSLHIVDLMGLRPPPRVVL
jgi:hypothetical protein